MKSRHVGLLVRDDVPLYSEERLPTDAEIAALENGGENAVLIRRLEGIGYVPPTLKKKEEDRINHLAELRARKARIETPQPLAVALRQAGVKPFKPESVEKYKKAMLRKPLQLMEHELFSRDPRWVVGWIATLSISVLCIFCAIMGWSTCAMYGLGTSPLIAVGFAVLPIVGGVVAVVGEFTQLVGWRDKLMSFMLGPIYWFNLFFCGPRHLEWKKVSLRGYEKDIPEQVLGTVAEIHHFCPEAEFEVDELVKKQDPFLVVKLDAEQYFVEVWAEPKFTAERLA